MKPILLSGEMLPLSMKREKVFSLVLWYGPLETPSLVSGLMRLVRRQGQPDAMQQAVDAFVDLVSNSAPEANCVLCTRIERTFVPTADGGIWNVMITGTPAVMVEVFPG
jgi:hypothetical protein